MLSIILVGILGAIVSAIIGTFWYSDKTPMGKVHMTYLGFDKLSKAEQKKLIEEAKPHMWKTYSLQMLLSFVTSAAIAFMVWQTEKAGMSGSYVYGYVFIIWIAFIVPNIGSGLLWGNCDRKIVWKKFFSDIFNNIITYVTLVAIAVAIL